MKSVFQKSATLLTLLVSTAVVSIPNRANAITIKKSGFLVTNNPITLKLGGKLNAHPGSDEKSRTQKVSVSTIDYISATINLDFNEDNHGTTGRATFGGGWNTNDTNEFGFNWYLEAIINPGNPNNEQVSTEARGWINDVQVGTVIATGTETMVPVPWETDALPVVGSTVLFGLGVWTKRKRKLSNFSEKDNTKDS
jgi:hypothetical protein